MTKKMALGSLGFTLILVVGCGGEPVHGSCDYRIVNPQLSDDSPFAAMSRDICFDYTGELYEGNPGGKVGCDTTGGTYSPGPCSGEGLLGSCRIHVNTQLELLVRYYDMGLQGGGRDEEDLKRSCETIMSGVWQPL